MRIDPKSNPLIAAAATQARRAPGAGGTFAVDQGGESRANQAMTSAAPIGSLDAILALQGEEAPGERRRRAARRGHDLLDALDRLKAALLTGRVALADLKQLAARLAERREATGDERLDDVIAHIELRAKVEIAKLSGRGPGA